MIKQVTTEFDVTVVQKWTCPECGKKHVTKYMGNPYRLMADNPIDEWCDGCENHFTLSFYNEDWVKEQNEEIEFLNKIQNG
jgi:hypothetical protein